MGAKKKDEEESRRVVNRNPNPPAPVDLVNRNPNAPPPVANLPNRNPNAPPPMVNLSGGSAPVDIGPLRVDPSRVESTLKQVPVVGQMVEAGRTPPLLGLLGYPLKKAAELGAAGGRAAEPYLSALGVPRALRTASDVAQVLGREAGVEVRQTPSSSAVSGQVRGGAPPTPPVPPPTTGGTVGLGATGGASGRPVTTPSADRQNNQDQATDPAAKNRVLSAPGGTMTVHGDWRKGPITADSKFNIDSRPYSEKMLGLMAAAPRDLSARATETGDLATGKTGTLSGLEQALARRQWLEGRAEMERGREQRQAEEKAKLSQAQAVERYALVDPLEIERVRAAGRYGDQMIRADQAAMADRVFMQYQPQLAAIQQRISAATTPEDRAIAQEEYRKLWDQAIARATLALGQRPYFPADNPLAALIGASMTPASSSEAK